MIPKSVRYATVLVILHTILVIPHTASHLGEGVLLSPLGTAFVILVIGLAPWLAVGFLYRRKPRLGAQVWSGAMIGAWVFGLFSHFLLPGPDNIASFPAGGWQFLFQLTVILLAVTQTAGIGVGAWLFMEMKQPSNAFETSYKSEV